MATYGNPENIYLFSNKYTRSLPNYCHNRRQNDVKCQRRRSGAFINQFWTYLKPFSSVSIADFVARTLKMRVLTRKKKKEFIAALSHGFYKILKFIELVL